MGEWYVISGIFYDGFKRYKTKCVVCSTTVKDAIYKASNYFCTNSECKFDLEDINRLDKNKVYELK